MRITLSQLEALVWVARLGTVSKAAVHLNVTQSTLSLRLKDLGSAFGKPMFRRSGRYLLLTPEGHGVIDHAEAIIDQLDKLHERARPEQIGGSVRLGVSEALALAGLPRILRMLKGRHPSLEVAVAIGTSGNLQKDLMDGAIDIALGINLHDDPRLRVVQLGIQKAAWIASSETDLPPLIRPRDIGQLPILSNPNPSPMYQQTVNWFRSEGLAPRQISVSNSVSIIASLVSAGVGLAILPVRLVEQDVISGKVMTLSSEPEIEVSRMCAAYRAEDWRPTIKATFEASREVVDAIAWLEPIP
ncbi:LysR family transcriptional regulator [Pararhizobium mangrovi]|uniref:LysR family transcriptional regulator n=1 Tax=Pararhizobium mangrovi TaxID=2590452 RepID=A0A506U4G3_9HYPH|nr:LysR family transcriptional regulator [Pararhizobium mangrovi]TPW27934.1 LysR family transcriptional regulator [Pararhizobium mangrovi]